MQLRELMSTRVVTIGTGEPVRSARASMRKHRIRHLVVIEEGALAGMLSERDLGGPRDSTAIDGQPVRALMNRKIVTATPTMRLRKAANLMRSRTVGSLPVLDGDRLVGIVTATDVLDAIGRGSTRPTRRAQLRTERMTQSRRQAARGTGTSVTRRAPKRPVGRARPRKPESANRAALPAWTSKLAKRDPAQPPPVHIRAAGGDLELSDRSYIRRKLGRQLGKFATRIERISDRTVDVNGSRGGIDRLCRIKVVLSEQPSVVVESQDAHLHAAIDAALSAVERAVGRQIGRLRTQSLRKAS